MKYEAVPGYFAKGFLKHLEALFRSLKLLVLCEAPGPYEVHKQGALKIPLKPLSKGIQEASQSFLKPLEALVFCETRKQGVSLCSVIFLSNGAFYLSWRWGGDQFTGKLLGIEWRVCICTEIDFWGKLLSTPPLRNGSW